MCSSRGETLQSGASKLLHSVMMTSESVDKTVPLLSGIDDEVEEIWQNQSFIPFRVGSAEWSKQREEKCVVFPVTCCCLQ